MTGKARIAIVILVAQTVIFGLPASGSAQSSPAAALTGRVSSAGETAMEGVLVTAHRAGATTRVTVVTDETGRYSFPRARLEPGQYSLTMRAIGYEMAPVTATVTASAPATANLTLSKTANLAAQLTNGEWLASLPEHPEKHATLVNCTECHTLQRVLDSKYDTESLMKVLHRMSTYYIGTMPTLRQIVPAFAKRPPELERFRKTAEYLSSVNLNKGERPYSLKTFARPTGKSTRVIVTEYDLPNKLAQPHDVFIGSDGMAWYNDFGQLFLGRLDPRTGKVTEYPIPVVRPDQPKGGLSIEEDKNGDIWFAMQFQAAVGRFDRKTGKFQIFPLPEGIYRDSSQVSMIAGRFTHVDGKVWLKDVGTRMQLKRLDVKTGKFEQAEEMPEGHAAYGIAADTKNNMYYMEVRNEYIGLVDATTLKMKRYRTPTPNAGPRRGNVDSQDRLWFGEFRVNKIGMFDPRTEKIQEWNVPTPFTNPYEAVLDKDGRVWGGGMSNDRVVRINTKSGEAVDYLLPRETNIRHAFVDNSTSPATYWVGNNHGASILKIEPLD